MAEDRVRVIRIVQIVGPRQLVLEQVSKSLHGTIVAMRGLGLVTAITLGEIQEQLTPEDALKLEESIAKIKESIKEEGHGF